LGMLRPALVAHTDALGAGNAVRQNGQRYPVGPSARRGTRCAVTVILSNLHTFYTNTTTALDGGVRGGTR
jgi:hypothetical protein